MFITLVGRNRITVPVAVSKRRSKTTLIHTYAAPRDNAKRTNENWCQERNLRDTQTRKKFFTGFQTIRKKKCAFQKSSAKTVCSSEVLSEIFTSVSSEQRGDVIFPFRFNQSEATHINCAEESWQFFFAAQKRYQNRCHFFQLSSLSCIGTEHRSQLSRKHQSHCFSRAAKGDISVFARFNFSTSTFQVCSQTNAQFCSGLNMQFKKKLTHVLEESIWSHTVTKNATSTKGRAAGGTPIQPLQTIAPVACCNGSMRKPS